MECSFITIYSSSKLLVTSSFFIVSLIDTLGIEKTSDHFVIMHRQLRQFNVRIGMSFLFAEITTSGLWSVNTSKFRRWSTLWDFTYDLLFHP